MKKERNVLFNRRKEMFYITMHSTHLQLYGVRHMANNHSDREETCCCHRVARVLLCASFHIQDNTYHNLRYTSRGALVGTRNSPMGPPSRIDYAT